MARDINANLGDPEGTLQVEAIAYELTTAGLIDMGLHFLPQRKLWLKDRFTWRMRWYGQEFRSWTDYIIVTYCRLL